MRKTTEIAFQMFAHKMFLIFFCVSSLELVFTFLWPISASQSVPSKQVKKIQKLTWTNANIDLQFVHHRKSQKRLHVTMKTKLFENLIWLYSFWLFFYLLQLFVDFFGIFFTALDNQEDFNVFQSLLDTTSHLFSH